MWGIRFTRSKVYVFSVFAKIHLRTIHLKPTQYRNPIFETVGTTRTVANTNPMNFCFPFQLFSFCTSNIGFPSGPKIETFDENGDNDNDDGEDSENFDGNSVNGSSLSDEAVQDVKAIMDVICETGSNYVEMKNKLERCIIRVSSELVVEILSRIRNDWEAAFTFFLWAGKQPGYAHSLRECHSMISILGKMRKFDTAWALIDEMRGGCAGPCLVTPQTLLIMIRRYCAVHDVGRAINTFYAYKKFKFDVGIEEFQSLLSALCRYKNVQDAEHLMFCNKDVFPFNIKSFNIILNGWCNAIGSPRQAERVWREMSKRGVQHDVVSYASVMSCYSKACNLHKVLKLFSQMKRMGIEPDRKVYNAVIHALAKARHVKEAINLLKTMEEKGIAPNVVTYNSLIKPLCKARKIDEARQVFDEMLQRDLSPTIRTYHVFFRILRNGEEVFELLEKMRKMGCQPTNDTYIMLIRKFSRWCQFDNVFKLWNEMTENGVGHDRSSYIVLIHGLFLNGKLDEAYKYYIEMKDKQFLPEPKIDEMLQAWVSGKQFAERQMADLKNNQLLDNQLDERVGVEWKKYDQEKDFLRLPETRKVIRERGFSFWEQSVPM
ncbi:pentatricopeptide repeat-containing protein At5g15010, mitochondrial [Herrania umbratica]|uniref:Pentatricopeptide repeat-containing protein At5g15010, mitochondrial n=1 Tax=Herrania umbratica TaxID=108875 RepID=A0A6J1A9H0_9ROSI|nr:pentatricopeptide repeat-containing protein At5g15010, mitochondrial [Herrania umbratica]XP_021283407.1 pentatricopeptide repeat-containing protein At5g15010, mitochondrial [Herrania umbratica]